MGCHPHWCVCVCVCKVPFWLSRSRPPRPKFSSEAPTQPWHVLHASFNSAAFLAQLDLPRSWQFPSRVTERRVQDPPCSLRGGSWTCADSPQASRTNCSHQVILSHIPRGPDLPRAASLVLAKRTDHPVPAGVLVCAEEAEVGEQRRRAQLAGVFQGQVGKPGTRGCRWAA